MEDDIQINAKSFFNKGLKKHQSIQNYSNNLFTNDLLYLMVSNSHKVLPTILKRLSRYVKLFKNSLSVYFLMNM